MRVEVYYSPFFIDEHSPLYKVDGYYFDERDIKLKDNSPKTTLREIYQNGGKIVDVKDLHDKQNSVRFIIEFN